MTDDEDIVSRYVLEALQEADEPFSPGRIQQRIASNGLDATTSAIRDACEVSSRRANSRLPANRAAERTDIRDECVLATERRRDAGCTFADSNPH